MAPALAASGPLSTPTFAAWPAVGGCPLPLDLCPKSPLTVTLSSLTMSTRTCKQTVLTAAATLLSLAAMASPASALKGVVNTATAAGTQPIPGFVTDLAWQTKSVSGTVAAINSATATNTNCAITATEVCNTIAVAFQFVMDSHASPVQADTATATDTNSFGCTAIAVAEQWVLASTGNVSLTAAGVAALAEDRANMADLLASPDPQTIVGELQYFEANENAVLANDVVTTPTGAAHWVIWKHQVSTAAN